MARMVRKQIVMEPEQETALAKLANDRGVSQSELIRRAIDGLLDQAEREAGHADPHGRLMDWFENAGRLGLVDETGKRQWTREELHERGSIRRHERRNLRG